MGELSLSVESLFGLHSRIMQLTYLKTQLTASPETSCQGLFNQIHNKSTKKVPEAL